MRKIKDWIILRLAEKETVYAGSGVYHWINYEGKIVIRNSQRVMGPKKGLDRNVVWENYQGVLATASIEQAKDAMDAADAKKEAQLQASAYYIWLENHNAL